jgi:serine/threonine protein kinase
LQGVGTPLLRAKAAYQVAQGMTRFHELRVVHFDLKAENVFCDFRSLCHPVVKIGDVGESRTKDLSQFTAQELGTVAAW